MSAPKGAHSTDLAGQGTHQGTTPVGQFLDHLHGVKREPSGWKARCPAHEDAHASLSVSEGDDGRVLVRCHAGCDFDAIVSAAGLEPRDLFPPKPERAQSGLGEIVATYDYKDEDGRLVGQAVRFSPKDFRQRRPDGNGGWEWKAPKRKIPYRLPELRDAIEGRNEDFEVQHDPIVIVEGEKDVDRLAVEGYVGTCNLGGAEKWTDEHAKYLRGAHKVLVVADNDDAGRKHAIAVARSLQSQVPYVEVVTFEGAFEDGPTPKGYDVSDFFADQTGLTLNDLPRLEWSGATSEVPDDQPSAEEPVEDGAVLLDDVARFVRRFVVCSEPVLTVLALWCVHTHAITEFFTTGRLFLTSPERNAGKTRVFEVLALLVLDPMASIDTSASSLYRALTDRPRTLLLDEVDGVFKSGNGDDTNTLLRGVLNSGYRRGQTVTRCIAEGRGQKVVEFETFGAAAFAGIGANCIPDPLVSRSIVCHMKRRTAAEPLERFRYRKVRPEADQLRCRISTWTTAHLTVLGDDEPELPDELDDRTQECWEPLLAVADAAGGDWPVRARAAALELSGGDPTRDPSINIRLLTAIRAALGDDETVFSSDLCKRLNADDEAPWGGWNDHKGINQRDLARRLGDYSIRSRTIRRGDDRAKGYRRVDFEDAWNHWLGAASPSEPGFERDTVTPVAPVRENPSRTGSGVTDAEPPFPLQTSECHGVTFKSPNHRGEHEPDEVEEATDHHGEALDLLLEMDPAAVVVDERDSAEPPWLDGIDEAETAP